MDALDLAILTAYAVNDPKQLETRRNELKARLRDDPSTAAEPKFTTKEMVDVAQRLMANVLKTGKLVS